MDIDQEPSEPMVFTSMTSSRQIYLRQQPLTTINLSILFPLIRKIDVHSHHCKSSRRFLSFDRNFLSLSSTLDKSIHCNNHLVYRNPSLLPIHKPTFPVTRKQGPFRTASKFIQPRPTSTHPPNPTPYHHNRSKRP